MGYIGREPAFGEYIIADSIASLQDGIETNFQITRDGSAVDLGAVNNILIFKDGASLVPVDEFLLGEDGTSIEFIEPPEVGEVIDIRILGNVFDTITVANNSITTNKYQNLSVTEDKLATGSVTTTKIGTGAVGSTNLASNSVSTSKVQDASISTNKLQSGSVTTEKIDSTSLISIKSISQTSISADYTMVSSDVGTHLLHPSTDANDRTFTIPSNSSVAYSIGTAITIVNMSANDLTVDINTDTLILAGDGSTGSRTISQYGLATILKISSTEWIITGTGVE